jgi:fatty acid-binding protein DegV
MTEKNVSRSGSWRVTAHALREQFIAENVLVYDGHAFQITQDFLAYVDTLVRNEVTTITVLDSSSIPCLIKDTAEFFAQLLDKHQEATNTLAMAWAARKNEL